MVWFHCSGSGTSSAAHSVAACDVLVPQVLEQIVGVVLVFFWSGFRCD